MVMGEGYVRKIFFFFFLFSFASNFDSITVDWGRANLSLSFGHRHSTPQWSKGSFLIWVCLCGTGCNWPRVTVFFIIRWGSDVLKALLDFQNKVTDERRMFSFSMLLLTSSYHSTLAIENKPTLGFHRALNERKRNTITQMDTNRYMS